VQAELRATFERVWDAMWTRGDATIVDEVMVPDYVRHTPRGGDQRRAELKQNVESLKTAFPDLETVIEDIFGEADRVVDRWRSRGTQTGEFMGVPATNKQVEVSGITISRVEGGRIVEESVSWDALEMLYRVGVIPDRAARTSATYPGLFSTDAFAVNILSREQREIARIFAASGDESKFAAVAWRAGVTGAPLSRAPAATSRPRPSSAPRR
jgi:steroid delta-isomerase-like uncharacterized protein